MDIFITCGRMRWRKEILDRSPEARRKLGRRLRNFGNDADDSEEQWGWLGEEKFETRCCIYTRTELTIRSSWNWIFHSCWLWSGSASPASVSSTNLVMLANVHESFWQLEVFPPKLDRKLETKCAFSHYCNKGSKTGFKPEPKDTFVYSNTSTLQL